MVSEFSSGGGGGRLEEFEIITLEEEAAAAFPCAANNVDPAKEKQRTAGEDWSWRSEWLKQER